MCTTITLVDHSCTRDQKIKTVIFFNPEDKNKIRDSCAVGDIVRLHRIKIQEYPTGQPQGLHMAKFSSWVCFKRAASDQEANTSAEFEHVGNKGNHTIYSEQDHIIVSGTILIRFELILTRVGLHLTHVDFGIYLF